MNGWQFHELKNVVMTWPGSGSRWLKSCLDLNDHYTSHENILRKEGEWIHNSSGPTNYRTHVCHYTTLFGWFKLEPMNKLRRFRLMRHPLKVLNSTLACAGPYANMQDQLYLLMWQMLYSDRVMEEAGYDQMIFVDRPETHREVDLPIVPNTVPTNVNTHNAGKYKFQRELYSYTPWPMFREMIERYNYPVEIYD